MIEVVLYCECPGCKATREDLVDVEIPGTWAMSTAEVVRARRVRGREMARELADEDGWFVERFPGLPARDICPDHADAYRTMLHAALEGT